MLKTSPQLAPKNIPGMGSRRAEFIIYAVTLKEHPGIVKIGMTTNWRNRRESYAYWNLRAAGDAIEEERVFVVNEEFVHLRELEKACHEAMPSVPVFGKEWFETDLDTACRIIDQVMFRGGLTYELA